MNPCAALLLLIPLTAHAATPPAGEVRIACPLWLPAKAFKAEDTVKGWTALMPQEARLTGGGMLHGAPDESAYLVPDDSKVRRTGKHTSTAMSRWSLEQPHSYEKWVYCGYGPLELFQRVPTTATECAATSRLDRGAFLDTVFVCK